MKTVKIARKTNATTSALPPIPSDTLEGARLCGIRDTLRAMGEVAPFSLAWPLEEVSELARLLNVPPLWIELLFNESVSNAVTEGHVEELIEWRHRLAAGAVATRAKVA